MKELIYDKKLKLIVLPETWDELSQEQYIEVAQLLHAGLDDDILKDKILKVLCQKPLQQFLRIPLDIRHRCYDHIQWVFEQKNLTVQLIPVYDKLIGPEGEFANLEMVEFHHAEIAYSELINEGNEDKLNELVAILYRECKKEYNHERNPDGDARIPFNFSEIAWHKKIVKAWPLEVKEAILLWYDGCRQQLVELYAPAFEKAKVQTNENYYEGLYSVIRGIAGGRHGTFKEVEHMNVHLAFLEIVKCIQEEKELEEQLKSHSV